MRKLFSVLADKTNAYLANPYASVAMLIICIISLAWGYAVSWNAVYSSFLGAATGLISLQLLVLLQHSQSKGDRATHIKLDEIILKMEEADNSLVGLEEQEEKHLTATQRTLRAAAAKRGES